MIISESFIMIYEAVGNVQDNPGREIEKREGDPGPAPKSPTFRGQWKRSQQGRWPVRRDGNQDSVYSGGDLTERQASLTSFSSSRAGNALNMAEIKRFSGKKNAI